MTLQGVVVVAIVAVAVWALLQRARAMLATSPRKGRAGSCHGCEDCDR